MDYRTSPGALALVAALLAALSITGAHAFDDSKYPDLSGVWRKPVGIGNQWDGGGDERDGNDARTDPKGEKGSLHSMPP